MGLASEMAFDDFVVEGGLSFDGWWWDAAAEVYRPLLHGDTFEIGRGYWLYHEGEGIVVIQTGGITSETDPTETR